MSSQNNSKSEICVDCKKEFTVTRYGWRIPCPHCQSVINIFPDPEIFLYINGAPIGIAIVRDKEGMALGIFSQLITRFLKITKTVG